MKSKKVSVNENAQNCPDANDRRFLEISARLKLRLSTPLAEAKPGASPPLYGRLPEQEKRHIPVTNTWFQSSFGIVPVSC
jgi:hypothetical protein